MTKTAIIILSSLRLREFPSTATFMLTWVRFSFICVFYRLKRHFQPQQLLSQRLVNPEPIAQYVNQQPQPSAAQFLHPQNINALGFNQFEPQQNFAQYFERQAFAPAPVAQVSSCQGECIVINKFVEFFSLHSRHTEVSWDFHRHPKFRRFVTRATD